jgi:REP element-mobilizing transposase RayT
MYHRKSIRLDSYDYSFVGCYFITLCTKHKKNLLANYTKQKMILTKIGQITENNITSLPSIFNNINVDEYIIMPNHIHFIIFIRHNNKVTLGNIIGRFKSYTDTEYCKLVKNNKQRLWQRNYHDHSAPRG